eukprot:7379160-Prymnesium_polylepis.2
MIETVSSGAAALLRSTCSGPWAVSRTLTLKPNPNLNLHFTSNPGNYIWGKSGQTGANQMQNAAAVSRGRVVTVLGVAQTDAAHTHTHAAHPQCADTCI